MYVIRRRVQLTPDKAMFIFVGDALLPPAAALMSAIYEEYKYVIRKFRLSRNDLTQL